MRYKLILLIVLTISIMSGCMDTIVEKKVNTTGKLMEINYMDKDIIINGEDFPDFKLIHNVYYISPENLTLTLETEMGHRVYEIDANTTIPSGYRLYGGSESYSTDENSSNRYMLLQYKVFDSNVSLDDTINMTTEDIYIKNGFKYKHINNTYRGNVVVLESNVTNRTDMNITIILFGFDTIIGKIGVQDYKDKSLEESLKMLDIVFDRLKVKTKDVEPAKLSSIREGNKSKI